MPTIASPDQLRSLFPHAIDGYLSAFAANERLLTENGLIEPLALTHFLAQAAAETGEFTIVEESGNYSTERLLEIFGKHFTPGQAKAYARKPKAILSRAYANRMGNGAEASGDGWAYRGRSFFQTTGKDAYARLAGRVGVDLIASPDKLAADFTLGLKAALMEWSALDLGRVARELGATHEAVLKIARGINVGNVNSSVQPNGLVERKKQFDKIWKALGNQAVTVRLDPAADGVLEEGEQGQAVSALQKALAGLGYTVGEADGTFGPRTAAAVAAFQAREKLGGEPGKWRIEWNARLAEARPFDDAARQSVTAQDIAAKGDGVMGLLLWGRRAFAWLAAFLGLDTAADKAGVQWPSNLIDLRNVIDPLAGELQWLAGSKWVLGIVACLGAAALADWGARRLVERFRNFGVSK